MYNSVAIRADSATLRQSISQNLAETVVVKETQSLTKERGVDPVTSSQTALFCPPNRKKKYYNFTLVNNIKFKNNFKSTSI